ncbi:glycosyltransferase family 22 protein [Lentinus tigrinus ALCF2SS1-7]|uniref:Mannosyltransferase n=1 Tax=Lentinus tigrinus ALCF2SS1-6 TaxID=1328759 RepID=A0A5C2SRV1_9APHY|nr:glycosyltransferase family 22 protein [Lentinus tigrinus ALCF2SS1-6]RPD80320.1 glycosyltransferase family 22 protein [Lentinus tigrinus ALCF2SS1-7]
MLNRPLQAVIVRVGIALATRTFFQPDEYFQSLEVAHHAVFGYGQLTWEWLSPKPIRSIVYPSLNIPVYWLLKVLKLDDTAALVWGPKLVHGLIAAGTDIWLMRLTRRAVGERYVKAAFYLSLTSFFHGLSLSRSISNSAETSLTTMALSYFPWDVDLPSWSGGLRMTLVLAALACAIRPTNTVLWAYMFAWLLWKLRQRPGDIAIVLVEVMAIGSITLASIFALDTAYYGERVFTPLNFLLTNASSVSLFYGTSPWHYYVTQAIPILCAPMIPWFLEGAYQASKPASSRPLKTLLGLIVWTLTVYSIAGHKEWRFIHPLLPCMHILAASSLADSVGGDSQQNPFRRLSASHYFLALSIPAIGYVMLFHERAQIEVIHYIRSLPAEQSISIGFLMPCHSTPWQAYLHRPDLADDGRLWALGCEPPLQGQNVSEYKDQTDIFYESPIQYLKTRFPKRVDPRFLPSPLPRSKPGVTTVDPHPWQHEWPQNLVFFGALLEHEGVRDVLLRHGYQEVWQAEYGWEGDGRRKGGVRVWRFGPAAQDSA